jgi:hypothetical protein
VTLLDSLVTIALVVLVSATALPVVAGSFAFERSVVGAHYLAGQLKRTQLDAVRRAATVGLRFAVTDLDTCWQPFADGNGDGVNTRDIDRGVDRASGPRDCLGQHARDVGLRVAFTVPDIGGGGELAAGSNPLRIGRSTLVSFSPTGAATSGTLYVAAPHGPQMAIRVFGATGRLRVLTFRPGADQWVP